MHIKTQALFAYIVSSFIYVPQHTPHGLWTSCASFSFALHFPSYNPIFFHITMPKFGASFCQYSTKFSTHH